MIRLNLTWISIIASMLHIALSDPSSTTRSKETVTSTLTYQPSPSTSCETFDKSFIFDYNTGYLETKCTETCPDQEQCEVRCMQSSNTSFCFCPACYSSTFANDKCNYLLKQPKYKVTAKDNATLCSCEGDEYPDCYAVANLQGLYNVAVNYTFSICIWGVVAGVGYYYWNRRRSVQASSRLGQGHGRNYPDQIPLISR